MVNSISLTRYPVEEIITQISTWLQADSVIANRDINSNTDDPETVSTNFYTWLDFGELQEKEKGYYAPAVTIFPRYRVDIEESRRTANETYKPLICIDLVIENYDLATAKRESYKFAEDIKTTLKRHKTNKNLFIFTRFILDLGKYKSNQVYQYAWRLILEIEYH